MAARTIEAKLLITGQDRGASAAINQVTKAVAGLEKTNKASAEVAKLIGQLGKLEASAKAVERVRQTGAAVASAEMSFKMASSRARELATALDTAKKASKGAEEIKGLTAQFQANERAVKGAASALAREEQAARAARSALNQLGVPIADLTKHQDALTRAISGTTKALQTQAREESRTAQARALAVQRRAEAETRVQEQMEKAAARAQVAHDSRRALVGMAGVALGHKAHEATHATLHTYRDFDKYKRQTQAFGNFSDPEMAKIVDMAIHGGATTRYNDIQWLQGAKALGGRGVKAGSVMGILPEAAQYGQAMSVDLPEAVAGLEGSLFAFRRDLSTPEAATKAARRTADLQVSAAKAFGLTHHDLKGGYEYGALGAEMTGLGEEKLLAFLGLGKKLNIDGITQGNAWRAMTSKYLSPTRKGREALAAAGVDYSARQQMPDRLSVDNFASMVAQQYGVRLDGRARAKLERGFTDKGVFTNASSFALMIKDAIKGQVGISNAKDANKVIGSAERFRQVNVEKVDVNGLFDDVMDAIKGGNLALANAVFGEKQGNRIMAALRDGDVWRESVKKIKDTQEGKAKGVADQMNAGYDGAMARFEGAIKNLETAAGRAWDDDGKGGFLTGLADAAAKATQALAELPRPVLQAGSALGYIGGKVATASGTIALVGSALALKGSAVALTAAAARLGATGLPKGTGPAGAPTGKPADVVGKATGAAPGGASVVGRAGTIAGRVAGVLGPVLILRELGEAKRPMTPEGAPYRLDQKIDPGTWERAHRGQMEKILHPEEARGREMMRRNAAEAASRESAEAAARGLKDAPLPPPRPPEFGALKQAASEAGTEAGQKIGTGIKDGLAEKAPEVEEQSKGLFAKIKSYFSEVIKLQIQVEGGDGLSGSSGSDGLKGSMGADTLGGPSGRARAGGGVAVPRGQAGPGTGTGSSWYEAVMRAEGTAGKDPYNVVLGNGRYGLPEKPLTEMTLAEAYRFGRTVRARHGASSALGAFQIVGRTMKGHMRHVGLGWDDKFSPENQRRLAASIRQREGWGAWEGFKVHPGELRRARAGGWEVPDRAMPPTAKPSEALERQMPQTESSAEQVKQVLARMADLSLSTRHTVEVLAGPGVKARTKSMTATGSAGVKPNVGVSMPGAEMMNVG